MTRSLYRLTVMGTAFAALCGIFSPGLADPYPPVDQKRPPIVIKHHGIFYAGAPSELAPSKEPKRREA